MAQPATDRCDLEQELGLDLPATRQLPPHVRSQFLDVLRTALDRERAKARSDLDAKVAGLSRLTRFAVRTTVLGRRR
jgi:hypothetical protein